MKVFRDDKKARLAAGPDTVETDILVLPVTQKCGSLFLPVDIKDEISVISVAAAKALSRKPSLNPILPKLRPS